MITNDHALERGNLLAGLSERRFGFSVGIILTIVALWPLWYRGPIRPIPGSIAAVLLLLALLRPVWLHWPMIVWVWVTGKVALLVNWLVLAVAFYVVITPLALFFRLTGRDPMRRRFDKNAKTYWIAREDAEPPAKRMRFQF